MASDEKAEPWRLAVTRKLPDFLVLAASSTPETRGFLNAGALARLPAGAVVVNIARGELVEDAALIEALGSGRVEGDLFDNASVSIERLVLSL